MPNHIKTNITISAENADIIKNAHIRERYFDDKGNFDFNKVIPQPTREEECEPEYLMTKDSCVQTLQDRPWFNWYDWNIAHWDTKWNAYDCKIKDGRHFSFLTAWSVAKKVLDEFARQNPELAIYVEFADEDEGCNCGILKYHNGALVDECYVGADCNAISVAFAKGVWSESNDNDGLADEIMW